METVSFKKYIAALEQIALDKPTAYMCSEAVWWRCHRSMVSDYLKAEGWIVCILCRLEKRKSIVIQHPQGW